MRSADPIELRNLAKRFKEGKKEVTIIDGLSFSFVEGVYIIKGASGCGKSTLLSLIGLLDSPSDGDILFFGAPSSTFSEDKKASWRRENVSYSFQDTPLFPFLSVMDNLRVSCGNDREIRRWAEDFGIGGLLGKKASTISEGEKERLSLVRVFLERKRICIFDEPTANLDPENSKVFFDHLPAFSKGKTVIVVSHESDEKLLDYPSFTLLRLAEGKFVTLREGIPSNKRADATSEGNTIPHFSFLKRFFLHSLMKRPWAFALSSILALSFGFIGPLSASFALKTPNDASLEALNAAGVDCLRADQSAFANGAMREVSFPSENGEMKVFYSDGPISFLNEEIALSDDEVGLMPSFCSSSAIKEGDRVTIGAKSFVAKETKEDYSLIKGDETPCAFMSRMALVEAWAGSYPVSYLSLETLSGFFLNNLALPIGTFGLSKSPSSSLEEGQIGLRMSSHEGKTVSTDFLSLLEKASFSSASSSDWGFDFSLLFKSFSVAYCRLDDDVKSGSLIIDIGDGDMARLLSSFLEIGVLSDDGRDVYFASRSFSSLDLADKCFHTEDWLDDETESKLSNYSAVHPWMALLAALSSLFLTLSPMFMAFVYSRSEGDDSVVLEIIGIGNGPLLKNGVKGLMLFFALPLGVSSFALYLTLGDFAAHAFSSWMNVPFVASSALPAVVYFFMAVVFVIIAVSIMAFRFKKSRHEMAKLIKENKEA